MPFESFKRLTIPEKAFTRTLLYFNNLKRKETAEFSKFTDILPTNYENIIIRRKKSRIYEPLAHWYNKIHSN